VTFARRLAQGAKPAAGRGDAQDIKMPRRIIECRRAISFGIVRERYVSGGMRAERRRRRAAGSLDVQVIVYTEFRDRRRSGGRPVTYPLTTACSLWPKSSGAGSPSSALHSLLDIRGRHDITGALARLEYLNFASGACRPVDASLARTRQGSAGFFSTRARTNRTLASWYHSGLVHPLQLTKVRRAEVASIGVSSSSTRSSLIRAG